MPRLTLFGIPKAFEGHIGVIQRNAIRSWTLLRPAVDVILFGDDDGTAEFAAELKIRHVAEIKKTEQGTPLLSDAFQQARALSRTAMLGYVNSDILLLDDFSVAAEKVAAAISSPFLMIGRRIDTDITKEFDAEDPNWRQQILATKDSVGRLAPRVCKDFFIFPKQLFLDLPDFAVGRANWDNWMVYHAHQTKIPVVDVTAVTSVIHQNHDYAHFKQGYAEQIKGREALANRDLAGGMHLVKGSVGNWVLTKNGIGRSRALSAWLPFLADMHRFSRLLARLCAGSFRKSN